MKSKIFLIVLITTNHLLYAQTNGIWTQKANLIGVKRMGAVGFSIGNYGYVGTGIDSSGNDLSDFWKYDAINDSWTQVANFGGGNREYAVSFIINGKGYVGTGGAILTNDLWQYDTLANTWTQKANFPGVWRSFAIGFSIGDKGYLGGGYDGLIQLLILGYKRQPLLVMLVLKE